MKKLIFCIMLLVGAGCVQAQSTVSAGKDPSIMIKEGEYYYYNNIVMDDASVKQFFQKNSEAAYRYYNQGQIMWRTGWFFLGGGVAITCLGGILYATATRELDVVFEGSYKGAYARQRTGIGAMYMGAALAVVSVPLVAVGKVRRDKACDIFNNELKETQAKKELSLQLTTDGLGLAFAF